MKVNTTKFFLHGICDNQISPLWINEHIHLEEDFYCNTHRKHNKEKIRKDAVAKFLKDTRRVLGEINLREHRISYLLDDGEFDFNQDQQILSISGDTFEDMRLSSSNIVGSLNIRGQQVNINCRFGNTFLAYMVASTSGFIELENFGRISKEQGLGEWILLLYWKNRLKRAFAKGIYKTYKKKRENLTTVRGAIDINHWIKKEYFNGKTMCTFKEHSFDNNINKVISAAIQKVSKSVYASLLYDIYDIQRAFQSIPFKRLKYNFKDSQVSNLFYENYDEVFDLSRQILEDRFMNLSSRDANFSAFLFDISLLFEHHVRKVLKKEFRLHPKDLAKYKVPNGVSENKLLPDVIIDYGNNEIGVFDVKYKRFQTEGPSVGVRREDRFQLISYIAYYSNGYKVVNSGFIFPCEEDRWSELNAKLSSSQTIDIAGNKIPFSVYFYRVASNIDKQGDIDQTFVKSLNVDAVARNKSLEEF